MSGNSFGDSMGWGSGRASSSSSSRKGKKGGGVAGSDKPKQPQRGLGVAQLEKIRIQSEMAEYFGQPPLIHRTGSLSLEDTRPSTSLSSSPSSSFHAATATVSPPAFPIHPNLAMSHNYGERGDIRYGEFQSTTIIRSPSNSAIYGAPHYSHPSVTLPLFEPEEPGRRTRARNDRSHSADSTSMNSDDPQDVDLELKL